MFGHDSVDVLVQLKKGKERVRKPLLLWCQGSLPRPLVLYDSLNPLRVFPFATQAGAESLVAHRAGRPQPRRRTPGDNDRTTSSFWAASIAGLLRVRVPILVGYGTRDKAVLSDDYLRLESMRLDKTNFTFREYPGREHDFSPRETEQHAQLR